VASARKYEDIRSAGGKQEHPCRKYAFIVRVRGDDGNPVFFRKCDFFSHSDPAPVFPDYPSLYTYGQDI
jgi:hypothetical protein